MKEEDAYRWFERARWHDNGGKPYCPVCGNLEVFSIRRRRFRCTAKECKHEFSVTSGTILANRKATPKNERIAFGAAVGPPAGGDSGPAGGGLDSPDGQ
nr:transposase [uncultured Rhodopila sp.]